MTTIPIDEEALKNKLTPEQYKILREKGTEAPFSSPLLNEHGKGMFTCAVCGNELFASDAKFDSHTGWPSFDQALPGAVEFHHDDQFDMNRTEVTCAKCGSHLGHVFDDGPAETTGKRFCINGACLLLNPEPVEGIMKKQQ
jgi:peptide-methionine (R)-S-oxide reductase